MTFNSPKNSKTKNPSFETFSDVKHCLDYCSMWGEYCWLNSLWDVGPEPRLERSVGGDSPADPHGPALSLLSLQDSEELQGKPRLIHSLKCWWWFSISWEGKYFYLIIWRERWGHIKTNTSFLPGKSSKKYIKMFSCFSHSNVSLVVLAS